MPQELDTPGKIYIKDNYLFINEVNKGIHIHDNSDPAQPVNLGFISIPGNKDLAIKDDILYADSYTDLVAIDISNPAAAVEVDRINDVFPYYPEEGAWDMGFYYSYTTYEEVDPEKGLVIGWEKTDTKTTYEFFSVFSPMVMADMAPASNSSGTGGSMARFMVVENYLYTIDEWTLHLFDISDAAHPSRFNNLNIGWDIETLFVSEGRLYIGAATGMYIYDISNVTNPRYLSEFLHVTACDPVVVSDNYAYVTVRSGNWCGGSENDLIIIDVSKPTKPHEVITYDMYNPHGLGIDGTTLFICDGDAGIKVYDTTDLQDLQLMGHIPLPTAYDVILNNNLAIVTAADGISQYDYTDRGDIILISHITVGE
jgi:hypothetical protein